MVIWTLEWLSAPLWKQNYQVRRIESSSISTICWQGVVKLTINNAIKNELKKVAAF